MKFLGWDLVLRVFDLRVYCCWNSWLSGWDGVLRENWVGWGLGFNLVVLVDDGVGLFWSCDVRYDLMMCLCMLG